MVFNNKELIRDVIKEYVMESNKNVFLKNGGKRMVISVLMAANFT